MPNVIYNTYLSGNVCEFFISSILNFFNILYFINLKLSTSILIGNDDNLYVILINLGNSLCRSQCEIHIHTRAHNFPFFSEHSTKIQENFVDRFGYLSYFLRYRMNKSFRAKRERVNKAVYIKYYILRTK